MQARAKPSAFLNLAFGGFRHFRAFRDFSVSSKSVFGKGVGNSKNASEMRQKCVRNASKWVLFYSDKRNVPKCVRNASKFERGQTVKN